VLGVSFDERLEERVEAILVVTGLGAVTLEETLPGFKLSSASKTESEEKSEAAVLATSSSNTESQPLTAKEEVPAGFINDLDVPAFLRLAR
jgi:hypothetical protein